MAYESIKKPASMFVPVQKKASESVSPGVMGQRVESSVPQVPEQAVSNTPATDASWLMKSPLFTGHHLLQKYATPVSESSERESEKEADTTEVAVSSTLPVQAKLTIGEPGDQYEQEADRVAADVVSRINSPQSQTVQREEMSGDEEELQMKPVSATIQREEMPGDEEELQMKPMVQRVPDGGGMAASADLEGAIQGARGSGQPLDEEVREPMEREFGADFSGVRVHTDATSDALNQSIQAKAFTTGEDIFFRQGAYEPGSRGGQELLAHELTHVVQQKGEVVQRKMLSERTKPTVRLRLMRHGDTNSYSRSPRASTNHLVIQRAVQVQVMWALPGTHGFAPKTVYMSEISGRPNGPQHDHTAAYVLFSWEVRNAVEGKTFVEALQALQPLVGDLETLPGFEEGTPIEIAQRRQETDALWNEIDDFLVDSNKPPNNEEIYHAQFLARFMEKYIELRNTIPLTAIQGKPGGSQKNEGAGATEIDKFVRDNVAVPNLPSNDPTGNDVEHLTFAMWKTWDYRPKTDPKSKAEIQQVAKIFAQWYLQVYRAYPNMPDSWSPVILTELLSDWNKEEAAQWGWSAPDIALFHAEVQQLISQADLHH